MKKIYFDYASTTPVSHQVEAAMRPYFGRKFGNPSSLHSFGQEALSAVDDSRERIAALIGANFREVVFAGSATEANNLALRGAIKVFDNPRAVASRNRNNSPPAGEFSFPSPRRPRFARAKPVGAAECSSRQSTLGPKSSPFLRIIVSSIEHESVLETARDLELKGVEVIYLPVDRRGLVDLKKLESSLNERTILVSIMYANNEIGTVQPITEITDLIRNFRNSELQAPNSKFPLFHTDAVQAFQFLGCDAGKLGADLMTLSAHKIYGPKGVGTLFVRSLKPDIYNPKPVVTGGGQEFGLRSGTENVAAIVGFAKAADLVSSSRESENERIGTLRDYFWKELKKNYPKAEINGASLAGSQTPGVKCLPNILNVCFPDCDARDLLTKLDLAGVAVSSGAACSARAVKPSHVLKEIGLKEKEIKSSLRFSFGRPTSEDEIKESLKRLKRILEKKTFLQ